MSDNTKLFIPDKCKVGVQMRQGTYTGKLGYIIYNDGKVWRKENSWNGWIHKPGQTYREWNPETKKSEEGVYDDSVAPIEFDNVPIEGFVLNKKAGGYSSGWNHRQTYSRVYDPRGWEFEITVENLIYILQECNSYKGKGLEGEFVYSWAGKDLVLLPVSSPDYVECKKFTDLQSVKFSKKDLIEGHTYLTNKMEQWVYLGYYDVYEYTWKNKTYIEGDESSPNKKYVFLQDEDNTYNPYEFLSSFSRIKKKISETPHPEFSDYLDTYLNSVYASKASHLAVEPLDEKFIKDTFERDSLYNVFLYPFINIDTRNVLKESRMRVVKSIGRYEVYTENNISGWDWRSSRTEKVSHGFYTLDEIKEKYGMLVRVYKNGHKEKV